jgi:CubicO group peptidase (beta-lactamase class C family)
VAYTRSHAPFLRRGLCLSCCHWRNDGPTKLEIAAEADAYNSGYFLLGVIIEDVSGIKYEDYLRKNIFEPLQMTATGYDWPAVILKDRASGYWKGDGGKEINAEFLDMGQPYAAGSLYSTALDLYKWDRALYTTKVLSTQSPSGRVYAEPVRLGRRNKIRLRLGNRADERPQSH